MKCADDMNKRRAIGMLKKGKDLGSAGTMRDLTVLEGRHTTVGFHERVAGNFPSRRCGVPEERAEMLRLI
jgi:hypothetical protein